MARTHLKPRQQLSARYSLSINQRVIHIRKFCSRKGKKG
jgi:hypothetical protein